MSSIVTGESRSTAVRVGGFLIFGALLLIGITVYVNGRPFWWRSCELVQILVEDATGLKNKSPVQSLGLQIGYLKTVELDETSVRLGICLTAPVDILPTTRAYIRGEGFLGDKFVELKPIRYRRDHSSIVRWAPLFAILSAVIPNAQAESAQAAQGAESASSPNGKGREIPVVNNQQDIQQMVQKVDSLVGEMKSLTTNLKDAIHPEEFRKTLVQLNRTLENASKTLSPESNINTTAQRTLGKLEDAVEQLRDQISRVNQGKGSVGRLLNDPAFADQIEHALTRVNTILNKLDRVEIFMTIGADRLWGYNSSCGYANVELWTKPDRYYLLGLAVDPRGRVTSSTTITTVGGSTVQTQNTQIDQGSYQLTAMLGKVLWNRVDLSLGLLYGDGAISIAGYFGPEGNERKYQVRFDGYAHGAGVTSTTGPSNISGRVTAFAQPWSVFFVRAGVDGFSAIGGTLPWLIGGGIHFQDEDLKLLFSFL